jgi:D-xylose transport system substrate-binding protein
MRKSSVHVAAIGVAAAFALAACSSSGGGGKTSAPPATSAAAGGATSAAASSAPATGGSGGGSIDGKGAKVGIILPDRQSSNRWISSDPVALKVQGRQPDL